MKKGDKTVGNKKPERLYRIYHGMKNRCLHEYCDSYYRYGGRGITICDEWLQKNGKGFKAFKEWALANGYNDNLTIDRIDTYGNYEPSNCRWITTHEQSRNTRANVWVEGDIIKDFAKQHKMCATTVKGRLERGLSGEDLIKPSRHRVVILNGVEYNPVAFSKKYGFKLGGLQSAFSCNPEKAKDYIIKHATSTSLDISTIKTLETKIIEKYYEGRY